MHSGTNVFSAIVRSRLEDIVREVRLLRDEVKRAKKEEEEGPMSMPVSRIKQKEEKVPKNSLLALLDKSAPPPAARTASSPSSSSAASSSATGLDGGTDPTDWRTVSSYLRWLLEVAFRGVVAKAAEGGTEGAPLGQNDILNCFRFCYNMRKKCLRFYLRRSRQVLELWELLWGEQFGDRHNQN